MKLLNIEQHSKAEKFMNLTYNPATGGYSRRLFKDIMEAFPEIVIEYFDEDRSSEWSPIWGHAWYAEEKITGMVVLFKENWDSSG